MTQFPSSADCFHPEMSTLKAVFVCEGIFSAFCIFSDEEKWSYSINYIFFPFIAYMIEIQMIFSIHT